MVCCSFLLTQDMKALEKQCGSASGQQAKCKAKAKPKCKAAAKGKAKAKGKAAAKAKAGGKARGKAKPKAKSAASKTAPPPVEPDGEEDESEEDGEDDPEIDAPMKRPAAVTRTRRPPVCEPETSDLIPESMATKRSADTPAPAEQDAFAVPLPPPKRIRRAGTVEESQLSMW